MKNLSIASIRTQVPGFYSADALTTMPRVPVSEQEFLSLKAFRSKAFSVAFMWSFLDMVVKISKPLSKLDLPTLRKRSTEERTQRNK